MITAAKRILLFLNMVINHGIKPSTILSNKKPFMNVLDKKQKK